MFYTPSNWYWIIVGSSTQVWSSTQLAYVPIADATYTAWLAAGNRATNIGSAAELVQVMQQQAVPLLQASGVAIISTSTPSLSGTYAIDPVSLANLTALSTGIAAGKPLPGGGTTFNYADIAGVQHAFTAAAFLNLAAAIESYVYDFDQALAALIAGQAATIPAAPLTIP
ncbi:MAG: hypothetical protein WCC64_06810 [Aliidongia sp.]